MKRKYEFTGESVMHDGKLLHQIRRLSDNLTGGFIESERNLSHNGDCFVYDNSKIYDEATVLGSAEVRGNSQVKGYAIIHDSASVRGDAVVEECALVYGGGVVTGNAVVRGAAKVLGTAKVFGTAVLTDEDRIDSGEIQIPHNRFFTAKSNNSRVVTIIEDLEGNVKYNVGCQKLITKEEFISRIHNEGGGLESNPHREFYLKILEIF